MAIMHAEHAKNLNIQTASSKFYSLVILKILGKNSGKIQKFVEATVESCESLTLVVVAICFKPRQTCEFSRKTTENPKVT